jgi:hypothetical protein
MDIQEAKLKEEVIWLDDKRFSAKVLDAHDYKAFVSTMKGYEVVLNVCDIPDKIPIAKAAGLSSLIVREIGRVILDINRNGTSILLVEQNAQIALKIAHRGYVLETGKIVLEGNAKDLLQGEIVKRAYLGQ